METGSSVFLQAPLCPLSPAPPSSRRLTRCPFLSSSFPWLPCTLERSSSPPPPLRPQGRRFFHSRPPRCGKMFVPGFGEASPEAEAAKNLQDFFTFVAVKIVLAQLQSYNLEAYEELIEFTDRNSLNDGDEFCRGLMRESPNHKALALRILEVQSAYSKRDFEWENLRKVAFKMVDESNTKLMREYILETSHIEDENGENS